MMDLVIRGGTIVDGSGEPGFRGDVAVDGGRIAAVGRVSERGRKEVDADGLVVAPGFVDVHTHYDAQYTWDPYATSSIWHGVTTTVIGNCGFAIAPCRQGDRETAMRTLVHVEGMSLNAMATGIRWGFETFPEYLDFLARCRPALNVAAFLGHSALRLWVMGEEAQSRAATEEEVEVMAGLTREAIRAGAIGLGSSTAEAHNGVGGLPVQSRLADFGEFEALLRAMGECGRGLFQITTGGGMSPEQLEVLHRSSGRPVCWAAFFHRDDAPETTIERLEWLDRLVARGEQIVPQVSCRPLTMDFTLRNPYPFEGLPCWQQVMRRPVEEWAAVYAEPGFRTAFKDDLANGRLAVFRGAWDAVEVRLTKAAELATSDGKMVSDLAQEAGADPVDVFLDLALADGLETEFVATFMNSNEEMVGRLLRHPHTLISLSDAGAHNALLCDAGYASHLLGHWVRDRGVLSLEEGVRRLSSHPAELYRIPERGRIRPGYWADITAFDPETIAALPNEWATDLPGGEGRFICRSRGVTHAWVNGARVLDDGAVRDGEPEERAGQVLREFAG